MLSPFCCLIISPLLLLGLQDTVFAFINDMPILSHGRFHENSRFFLIDEVRCFASSLPRDKKHRRFEDAIVECSKKNDVQGCLLAFQELRRRGLRVSDHGLFITMKVCTRVGKWEKSVEIFEQSTNFRDKKNSDKVFHAAIEAYGQGKYRTKIWDTFKRIPSPNTESYSIAIESMVRCNDLKFLDLFQRANLKGINIHSKCFTIGAEVCRKFGLHDEASFLIKKLEMDRAAFIKDIQMKSNQGDHEGCLVSFQKMLDLGIYSDADTYSLIMMALADAQKWAKVLNVYDKIPDLKMISNHHQFLAFKACEALPNPDRALQMLDTKGAPLGEQEKLSEIALNACIAAKSWRSALQLSKIFMGFENRIEPKVYWKLLKFLNDCGQYAQTTRTFDQIKQDGIRPTLKMYKEVLFALSNQSKWVDALLILKCMEKEGIAPDIDCIGSVINALSKEGKWEDAVSLLVEATSRGLKPRSSTYGGILAACNKANNPEKCLEIYQKIVNQRLKRNHLIFRHAITAHSILADSKSAYMLLEEMDAEDIRPTTPLCNIVLETCQKEGNYQLAEKVLQKMNDMGVMPDQRSYSAALMASGRAGKIDQSFSYMTNIAMKKRRKRKKDKSNDIITYNRLINACEIWGKYEKAIAILNEMEKQGISPDLISFQSAMVACDRGGQPDLAIELFQKMKKRGIIPNNIAYQTAISSFFRNGNLNAAINTFGEASDQLVFKQWTEENYASVDLHGMTLDTALVAVLDSLQQYAASCFQIFLSNKSTLPRFSPSCKKAGLFLITGKGKNSVTGKPVLKPAVMEMLNSKLIQPLKVEEYKQNPGRILIQHEDIEFWLQSILMESPNAHHSSVCCFDEVDNIYSLNFEKVGDKISVNSIEVNKSFMAHIN